MSGFVLESERLRLRPLVIADGDRLFALINDYDIVRNLSVVPWPYERSMADDFIRDSIDHEANGEQCRRAIVLCETGEMIGLIDLRPADPGRESFGYWLGKDYWGQGFMSEALGLLVDHAFGTGGMDALTSGALIDNHGSLGVMRKNGFVPAERFNVDRPALGDRVEMQRMLLTRAAWKVSKS